VQSPPTQSVKRNVQGSQLHPSAVSSLISTNSPLIHTRPDRDRIGQLCPDTTVSKQLWAGLHPLQLLHSGRVLRHVIIDVVVVVEEIVLVEVVVVVVVTFLGKPKFQASANALTPAEGTMIFQAAIAVGGALVVETDDGVKVVNVVFDRG